MDFEIYSSPTTVACEIDPMTSFKKKNATPSPIKQTQAVKRQSIVKLATPR